MFFITTWRRLSFLIIHGLQALRAQRNWEEKTNSNKQDSPSCEFDVFWGSPGT